MKITVVSSAPTRPNPHGVESKTIYNTDHGALTHLLIQPGQALKKHITSVDCFFYVVEGECEVEIGEEVVKVGLDSLVESPAGIPHSLRNPGTSTLRVLVMKVPKPTANTVLL